MAGRAVEYRRRFRWAGIALLIANEVRGVIMTAPIWVALWHYWFHK